MQLYLSVSSSLPPASSTPPLKNAAWYCKDVEVEEESGGASYAYGIGEARHQRHLMSLYG